MILDGDKTWEIRGSATTVRGRIALLRSGASRVAGVCDLVDCTEHLTLAELRANAGRAGFEADKLPYKRTFAWYCRARCGSRSPSRSSRSVPSSGSSSRTASRRNSSAAYPNRPPPSPELAVLILLRFAGSRCPTTPCAQTGRKAPLWFDLWSHFDSLSAYLVPFGPSALPAPQEISSHLSRRQTTSCCRKTIYALLPTEITAWVCS